MKKILLFMTVMVFAALACRIPLESSTQTNAESTPTEPTLETMASSTHTPSPQVSTEPANTPAPAFEGAPVFYGAISLVIPAGLTSGISGEQFPRLEGESVAPWDVTPGHTQIMLEGYLWQGKFHQPRIFVYPAQAYAEQNPGAFESLRRINNFLYDPGAPVKDDQLPTVPFFNAAQLFASNVQPIDFQNGRGVRFLTQYAQNAAPVNNHELFYHFQGITEDGAYYVIAILPIAVPFLAESSDTGTVIPDGGISFPDMTDPNAEIQGYYRSVTDLFNSTPQDHFSPGLTNLDALIQSIQVNQ
jgi:hypothetical protein